MYDNDALTVTHEQIGPGNYTFFPSGNTRYILAVGVQQSGTASDTVVYCGSSIVSRNYAKDVSYQQISYKCDQDIRVEKTGNDSAFVSITYVPRDLSLTQNLSVSASVSASLSQDQIHMFYTFDVLILMCVGILIGFFAFK